MGCWEFSGRRSGRNGWIRRTGTLKVPLPVFHIDRSTDKGGGLECARLLILMVDHKKKYASPLIILFHREILSTNSPFGESLDSTLIWTSGTR